jgi:phage repressor protein C with HTH and peptisase S24 domain
MLDFNSDEKQRIERANQIFLRLRKELHDREAQFAERDLREAAQSARWLSEIVEQHPTDWEQAYEDALAESDLPKEDADYLRRGAEEAGGFLPFIQRNLQCLKEAAPDEGEQADDPVVETTHRGLVCRVVAGLIAGGVMAGNAFYFGFAVGMSRKANCW